MRTPLESGCKQNYDYQKTAHIRAPACSALLRAPRGQLPEEQPALDYGRLLSGARVRRQEGWGGTRRAPCRIKQAPPRGGPPQHGGDAEGVWGQQVVCRPQPDKRPSGADPAVASALARTRLPRPSVPESAAPCSGHAPTNLMFFTRAGGAPARGRQRVPTDQRRPDKKGAARVSSDRTPPKEVASNDSHHRHPEGLMGKCGARCVWQVGGVWGGARWGQGARCTCVALSHDRAVWRTQPLLQRRDLPTLRCRGAEPNPRPSSSATLP